MWKKAKYISSVWIKSSYIESCIQAFILISRAHIVWTSRICGRILCPCANFDRSQSAASRSSSLNTQGRNIIERPLHFLQEMQRSSEGTALNGLNISEAHEQGAYGNSTRYHYSSQCKLLYSTSTIFSGAKVLWQGRFCQTVQWVQLGFMAPIVQNCQSKELCLQVAHLLIPKKCQCQIINFST